MSVNGPLLMLLANLFFGLVPLTVRWGTAEGIPAVQLSFFRFLISCFLIAGIVAAGWGKLRSGNWNGLIWRGLFGAGAVLFYFYAIQMTSAAKGTLLNYTHSIWANIFAVAFIDHKAPRGFWLLLALAAVGLWLVIDPHFDTVNLGDALGLISGALGGGAVLTVRELRKTDNSLSIFASFSVIGLLCALAPGLVPLGSDGEFFAGWIWPSTLGWCAIAAMTLVAMAGQLLFTYAYAYTSLELGTLMALSVPALAAIGGWGILGETMTSHFILGGTLILTACGMLGIREGRGTKEKKNPGNLPGNLLSQITRQDKQDGQD